jgi:hypothetical protein
VKQIIILMLLFSPLQAQGDEIDIERLADAVYYAEGGSKTNHPYGILTKYKHTTPRQACINSIKSAMRRSGSTDPDVVIPEMGRVYCPVGASNDPTGLNKNWVGNVTRLYNKGSLK